MGKGTITHHVCALLLGLTVIAAAVILAGGVCVTVITLVDLVSGAKTPTVLAAAATMCTLSVVAYGIGYSVLRDRK